MQLPSGHHWSEFIRQDTPFWHGIRSSLVAFVGFGPTKIPEFIGTGFVIGTTLEGGLLVVTAKHVVVDGAIQVQGTYRHRASNAPSVLFDPEMPRIDPDKLRAVWMGPDHVDVLVVKHVSFPDGLDVAVCVLEVQHLQPDLRANIHKLAPIIALDTRLPAVGDCVHVVTLTDHSIKGAYLGTSDRGLWNVSTRPVVRVGRVLSHQEASMGHKAPTFTTSIPTSGGMSGGFAYVPREGHRLAACGIISSSPTEDQGQFDFGVSGCSTIVGIIGTLGAEVPVESEGSYSRLIDLVKSGVVTDVAGAEGLVFERTGLNGEFKVFRRGKA